MYCKDNIVFVAVVAIYFGVRMVGELLPVYMEWAILGFLGFTLLVDIIFLAFRRGLSDSRGELLIVSDCVVLL